MDRFTKDECATIRKFTQWLADGDWLDGYSEGVTGSNDDGVTVTEFTCVSDYDGCSREQSTTFIPWIALTDPEEYDLQVEAEKREQKRLYEQQRRDQIRQREAEERRVYETLRAKFETR